MKIKKGRSAKDGRFIPIKVAKAKKASSIIQTINRVYKRKK